MRTNLAGVTTFVEAMKRTKATMLDVMEHADCSCLDLGCRGALPHWMYARGRWEAEQGGGGVVSCACLEREGSVRALQGDPHPIHGT